MNVTDEQSSQNNKSEPQESRVLKVLRSTRSQQPLISLKEACIKFYAENMSAALFTKPSLFVPSYHQSPTVKTATGSRTSAIPLRAATWP